MQGVRPPSLSDNFARHQFRQFNGPADAGASAALRGIESTFMAEGLAAECKSGHVDLFRLEFDGGSKEQASSSWIIQAAAASAGLAPNGQPHFEKVAAQAQTLSTDS